MSTFRSPTVRRCGSTRPRTPAIARGTTDRRVTVNGGTGSVMRILEHLRRQGHQALVVAPDEGPDEHDGVRVVRVPAVSIPGAAVPPVGLPTWRLQKVMAEFAPEVVHLASPIVLGAGGLAAARRMIVGHVGRLAPEKHVERLAALDDLPGVRVVVVGDGPERSHLQRGLPQAVFLGMLTGRRARPGLRVLRRVRPHRAVRDLRSGRAGGHGFGCSGRRTECGWTQRAGRARTDRLPRPTRGPGRDACGRRRPARRPGATGCWRRSPAAIVSGVNSQRVVHHPV